MKGVMPKTQRMSLTSFPGQWQWILNLTLAHLTSHEFHLSNFHVCNSACDCCRDETTFTAITAVLSSMPQPLLLNHWTDLGPSDWSVTVDIIIIILLIVRIYSYQLYLLQKEGVEVKPTNLHPYLLVFLANREVTQLWVMVDGKPFLKFTGTSSTSISMAALLAVHFILNRDYAAAI